MLQWWDFDDIEGSRARFEALGDDPVARTQVARCHGLAGDFAAGHAVLDALGEVDGEAAVRLPLERGRLWRSSGDPQVAEPLFRQAYEMAVRAAFPGLAADAAHMMALVSDSVQGEECSAAEPRSHGTHDSDEWTQRGLAVADGVAEPLAAAMTGALLNNKGWALAEQERWDEAYPLFDRAVAARQLAVSLLDAPSTRGSLHVARWTRARAARALGRKEDALAELRELSTDDPYVVEEIAAAEAL